MKTGIIFITLIASVILVTPTFCQIQFEPHTITTSADHAWSVFAIDVDGDEDIDVLSASLFDDKIAWYENDGSQNFYQHDITTSAEYAMSVFAIDVDGDEDIDVLSASGQWWWWGEVSWYENDGSENFTTHVITNTAAGVQSVFAIDVDGDEDIDVLSASHTDDKIAWYENDGSENFTTHVITDSADGARSVFAIDVDGDDDIDVLSAVELDDQIAWYENDGLENFTTHVITTSADNAFSVFAIDVDGDEDIDVLSASCDDDKIAWYENDGFEHFSTHVITDSADSARFVFAIDVDGDGDIDVLSASWIDDKIAWYENDGLENFTTHVITDSADGAWCVFACDVDGDKDIDVLSASEDDDKIAWYQHVVVGTVMVVVPKVLDFDTVYVDSTEVLSFTIYSNGTDTLHIEPFSSTMEVYTLNAGTEPITLDPGDDIAVEVTFTPVEAILYRDSIAITSDGGFAVVYLRGIGELYSSVGDPNTPVPQEFIFNSPYPNPFNASTVLRYGLPQTGVVTLTIYNVLGQKVATLFDGSQQPGYHTIIWNAANTPSGIYFCRMSAKKPMGQAGTFTQIQKLVLLK